MLTIFVEVIMSVFIASFKASEHPIVSNIARGILIAIGFSYSLFILIFLKIEALIYYLD